MVEVSFWADHVVSLLTVVKTLRPLVNISYSLIGLYWTWFEFYEIFERDQANKLSLVNHDHKPTLIVLIKGRLWKHYNKVILNNVFTIILTFTI